MAESTEVIQRKAVARALLVELERQERHDTGGLIVYVHDGLGAVRVGGHVDLLALADAAMRALSVHITSRDFDEPEPDTS